jgi:hypothetical protein
MRDIRGDLQDRVDMVEQQITVENAQFERLIAQLKTKQDSRLEHLRAQLRLANKLLEFMAWQYNVRAGLVAAIAVAEAAEAAIERPLENPDPRSAPAPPVRSSPSMRQSNVLGLR